MADSSQLFPKAEDLLLREGAMRKARLGDATVRIVSCRKSADILLRVLRTIPSSSECPDPNENPRALSQIRRGRRDCL